ncbi:MAG: AAA family ATPase [Bacteroidales bacterium]|nr:AAA family ATPase [Bacteroidales bacterium]
MNNFIISREKECDELQAALESDRSEFVVVSGRRRIGKTYLVETFFDHQYDFTFVGAHNAPASVQRLDFAKALTKHSGRHCKIPRNWYAAFDQLEEYLEGLQLDRKIVIFIDEMPWVDTPKSNFVVALERFWNGWAARRNDVVFIATGSATSWMSDKLLGNKGGLHARVTRNLHLAPFTLRETEEYLCTRGIGWDRYQITQAYMAFGGVPFYLSLLESRLSLAQNIDALFFSSKSRLKQEFHNLFHALFKGAETYINVVKLLAEHSGGLTHAEIGAALNTEGSFLSNVLNNLEQCDFISRFTHYGNAKRESVFRLIDHYSLFYQKFVGDQDRHNPRWWSSHNDSPSAAAWMGCSFELVCLTHAEQIKKALGISGISVDLYTWRYNGDHSKEMPGFQIDLILERADRHIHLCEMKFSKDSYALTSDYEQKLRDRSSTFRELTKTRKTIVHTFITTYGVRNVRNHSIVHSEVTMDDLFKT